MTLKLVLLYKRAAGRKRQAQGRAQAAALAPSDRAVASRQSPPEAPCCTASTGLANETLPASPVLDGKPPLHHSRPPDIRRRRMRRLPASERAAPALMTSGLHLYSRLLRLRSPVLVGVRGAAVFGMVVVAAGDTVMTCMVVSDRPEFPEARTRNARKWLPLAIVGVFVLRGIGSYVSDYGMAYTGHRVVFDLRRALIDKLLALPTPYYDVTPAGVVQSKLTFDAHQLASAASARSRRRSAASLTIARELRLAPVVQLAPDARGRS